MKKVESRKKILIGCVAGAVLVTGLLIIPSLQKEYPGDAVVANSLPGLFPDYTGISIPINMAPLNFRINTPCEKSYVEITNQKGNKHIECFGDGKVRINLRKWHALLTESAGDSLRFKVSTKNKNKWTTWKTFSLFVSPDSIDSHMAYRLIEPGYEKWHIVGIYQRNLESFEEKPVIVNKMTGYNCINCHSFCGGNPQQMLFHMRADNGGTYIVSKGEIEKLQTKTDKTISNLTYPYWHPSGNYIVSSVNTIRQFFHAVPKKKMEVFDTESDIVVYDIAKKEILSKASIITKDAYETFPSFSADGKWLYFCSAPALKMPEEYNKLRYNLCRVSFDAKEGVIGSQVDTLVIADSVSTSFPRISPDGKFMMYTETAYGQFPIWHKDAEIRMINLKTGKAIDMKGVNSPDTESYHTWSSNSRWFVISSRRENGVYTLPYIVHVDEQGNTSKPFLLPQEDPDLYDFQLYSYNIPELIKGEIEVSPYDIQHAATQSKGEQIKFHE